MKSGKKRTARNIMSGFWNKRNYYKKNKKMKLNLFLKNVILKKNSHKTSPKSIFKKLSAKNFPIKKKIKNKCFFFFF